ncbi:MAG: CHAP domain-containing protein [Armatimonadota bacterium]|jgi:hypothetical protein
MHIRTAVLLIAIALSAVASADSSARAMQVVADTAAEVERDLAARRGAAATPTTRTLEFDPLQRAQGNLAAWTRVPSRGEIAPRTPGPAATAGPTTMPGGMTREYFGRLGTSLTFPADAQTARAIRRMARGEVSSVPNYCARTLREALGWGLGDAHRWTNLPSRGYTARPRGTPAQPGDIVVWPFTYGSRNSQHVGVAVGTDSGVQLLSNLSGDLGLTPMVPGYRTYWK